MATSSCTSSPRASGSSTSSSGSGRAPGRSRNGRRPASRAIRKAALEVGAQEQVARLLREANIFRIRHQMDLAEAKCREALALLPDDAGTIEMLADLLRARDKLPEAADQYRRAMEL